jgi:RND superfamily putative drug exporter
VSAPVGELFRPAVAMLAHARVPLGRGDGADADRVADRAAYGSCCCASARRSRHPSVAPTLGVLLGLGAGIDYALLIVGRYRERSRPATTSCTARAWPTRRRTR